MAKIVVIPEHASLRSTQRANSNTNGVESNSTAPGREIPRPFRRGRRKWAAESILSSIRRHYSTFADVASYVGLGLVLYAGVRISAVMLTAYDD